MMKSTYGTGCFALLNTGDEPVASQQPAADHRRLPARRASRTYALEGAIFVAGAAVQWLRDGLGLIARRRRDRRRWPPPPTRAQSVYLVPAFVGLGAPLLGRRGARRALRPDPRRPVRASSPAPRWSRVGYQTRDLIEAMRARLAGGGGATVLRVDGGMVASDWTHAVPRRHPRRARSTGRWCWRRRRSARPISPGCRRGSARRPDEFADALAARPPLHPGDAGGRARRGLCRLAAGGAADPVRGGLGQRKRAGPRGPAPVRCTGETPTSSPPAGSRRAWPGSPACSAIAGPCPIRMARSFVMDPLSTVSMQTLLQRFGEARSPPACCRTGRDRPGRGSRRRSRRSGWCVVSRPFWCSR